MNDQLPNQNYSCRCNAVMPRYFQGLCQVLLTLILMSSLTLVHIAHADEPTSPGAFKPDTGGEQPKPDLVYSRPEWFEFKVYLPKTTDLEQKKFESTSSQGPLKIGIHRDIPYRFSQDLSTRINWLKDGNGLVGYLNVRSPDAHSIRFLANFELPAHATLVFYEIDSVGKASVIYDVKATRKGIEEDQYWSPEATGESIGVEIRLPDGNKKKDVQIEILKIAHRFANLDSDWTAALDCDNHIEIQCAIDDEDITDGESRTVLKMSFESDGLSWLCSGTLMNVANDGEGVFRNYVLTAAHCVSTSAEAASVVAHWHYQTSTCTSSNTSSSFEQTFGGADLLATEENFDQSLIELREDPAAGVWYSGWWATDVEANVHGYVAGHPGGEHKKFFSGTTSGNATTPVCDEDGDCFDLVDAIILDIDEGAAESGVSGSGLRIIQSSTDSGRLVGVFSALNAACVHGRTWFGEFRNFYPSIEAWFDPDSASSSDDHGDDKASATVVSLASSTAGTIDDSDDVDYFKVVVDRLGILKVYTSSSIDTIGELSDEDDTLVVTNDDSGAGLNFSISQEVHPGTYYIKVEGYSNSTGNYTLNVEFEQGDDHGDTKAAATIQKSSAQSWFYSTDAHINESDDVDVFEIEVYYRSKVSIYTEGSTDTEGRLENTDGVKQFENDDTDDENANFLLSGTVDKGTYYLYIEGDVRSKSPYKLILDIEAR